MDYPKVTVITPTTGNRILYLKRCMEYFSAQDYPNKEHLHIAGDDTIAGKLNTCCAMAKGEIILRFDDDDIYAPDWITKSVQSLIESKADITGLSNAYFYRPNKALYDYQYAGEMTFVLGATMCFWKKTWENSKKKFYAISYVRGKLVGEDKYFCVNNGLVVPHTYKEGFMATLHGGNTSSQFVTTNQYAKKVDISIAHKILNAQGQPII